MQARAYVATTELPHAAPDCESERVLFADEIEEDGDDPLSAGRGIALGMVLALPCWAAIGLALYWLLRWVGI